MIYVKLIRTADGQEAVVQIGEHTGVVSPDQVALQGGRLILGGLPATIEAPEDCTIIERWLEPGLDQIRLAVEGIPDQILDRLLAEESAVAGADMTFAVIVKRAIGRFVTGDIEVR